MATMFYIFSWGVDCVPELEFVQIETVVIDCVPELWGLEPTGPRPRDMELECEKKKKSNVVQTGYLWCHMT